MLFRGKRFEDLEFADIQRLVDNQVREDVRLDYKANLSVSSDGERKEFLADVSAFANTEGGAMIFGVPERRDASGRNTGLPDTPTGVGQVNADEISRRLDSIIRDGTEPSLTGFQIRVLEGSQDCTLVAIGIRKSPLLPHAVSFKGNSRFYRRTTAGKYQVSVSELRNMFSESYEAEQRIDAFRQNRVERLRNGRTTPGTRADQASLIHILPLGMVHSQVDIIAHRDILPGVLRPPMASGGVGRPNFDGYLVYSSYEPRGCVGYVQWLRSGGVEAYTSEFHGRTATDSRVSLHVDAICGYLAESAVSVLNFGTKMLGIGSPWVVILTMLGVKGLRLYAERMALSPYSDPITEDELYFPPVMIDSPDAVESGLRPLWDMVWQAGGLPQMPDFIAQEIRRSIQSVESRSV